MFRNTRNLSLLTLISFTLIVISLWFIAPAPSGAASSDTNPAHTLRFFCSYTNPYVVLFDYNTGFVLDASTGVAATGETFAANPITATRDTDRGWWTASIPATSKDYNLVLFIGDNASPAYTDTSLSGITCWYYSAETKQTITGDMPNARGKLLIN